jgi:hypothetical protein
VEEGLLDERLLDGGEGGGMLPLLLDIHGFVSLRQTGKRLHVLVAAMQQCAASAVRSLAPDSCGAMKFKVTRAGGT